MTMTEADTTTEGALAGIRVLELANFMAGPFCGMLLADMGAEVIKVENPAGGDYTRTTPPFVNGESAGFLTLNRNKKSVTLNLKSPKGRALFLELAATADVILENFRPGTMTDLGIDYEAVCAVRPDIIYCSASEFGQHNEEILGQIGRNAEAVQELKAAGVI
jgi:CoA:oxalate CoA-transferase